MTREEAIEAIKEAYGNSEYTYEIIKALEQEPTTKNDLGVDCISRVGVIDRVITYFDHIKKDNSEWSKGYEAGAEDAIEVIKSIPSVTPKEPKTGHWIDKDEKSAVCSCCNRNNTLYGDFCKWCGARMEKGIRNE